MVGGPKVALDLSAVGHVADGGDRRRSLGGLHWAEADIDRHFHPVLSKPDEIEASAHRTAVGVGVEAGSLGVMLTAHRLGDQEFDRLTDERFHLMTKERRRLRVRK